MPWKQKPFGWGNSLSQCILALESTDATIEALKSVKQAVDLGDEKIRFVEFETETLEPPSIDNVIRLFLDQEKRPIQFKRKARSIPDPDPRVSHARHPLWKFRFGKPIPVNHAISSAEVVTCIEIAEATAGIEESWTSAKLAAKQLKNDSVASLLGVSVQPPAPRNGSLVWHWLRRIQLASAQIALAIECDNGVDIENSRVTDVTKGPLDWCIDAALIALAQKATEDRSFVPAVCSIADEVLQRVPSQGSWSCGVVASAVLHSLES
jgi:hypothetical protein